MNAIRRIYNRLTGRQALPPGMRVGANVHIGESTRFDWSHGRHITIDDAATIAPGVRILCHDASSYRRIRATWVAPVRIGKRAFIGTEAVIMPGVEVGDDAIVAAGAVVTRSVEPGTIVAGIPAKQVDTVAHIDARRLEQMQCMPCLPASVYEKDDLSEEHDALLQQTAAKHGGYFLVDR